MFWKKNQWILMPICLVFGLALLFAFVRASQSYLSDYLVQNSKSLVGQKLDLAALSEHLKDPRLAEFAKTPTRDQVVFAFWAVHCAPCLKDLPKLAKEHSDALVVVINTDTEDKKAEAEATLKQLAPEFPFTYDQDRRLEKQLKITYLPSHVYIDREGNIKKFTAGAF